MSLDHKIFKDAALDKSKITTKKQDCGLNNQENLNFILNYYSNIVSLPTNLEDISSHISLKSRNSSCLYTVSEN